MKTWREILGAPPETEVDIPKNGDNSDKSPHQSEPSVTIVTSLRRIGIHADVTGNARAEALAVAKECQAVFPGSKVTIEPCDPDRRRGKSPEQWLAEQRDRNFADGRRARRSRASEPHPQVLPTTATPFQASFFSQLELLPFENSKAKVTRNAIAAGIPKEAATAFLKTKNRAGIHAR